MHVAGRAKKYQEHVLQPHLLSSVRDFFRKNVKKHYIFQEDGPPCHTAKTTVEWFKNKTIRILDWSGNSSDLNPIENLWYKLKDEASKKILGTEKNCLKVKTVRSITL